MNLITIARFQYTSEALIIQGKLESEGIQTFLADSTTINTDPLVSNAIGGVKLQVWENDLEKAKTILDQISEYSLDNEGEPLSCPNCGKQKIDMVTSVSDNKSLWGFIIGCMFGSLPLFMKYKYKCSECNFEFFEKKIKK